MIIILWVIGKNKTQLMQKYCINQKNAIFFKKIGLSARLKFPLTLSLQPEHISTKAVAMLLAVVKKAFQSRPKHAYWRSGLGLEFYLPGKTLSISCCKATLKLTLVSAFTLDYKVI